MKNICLPSSIDCNFQKNNIVFSSRVSIYRNIDALSFPQNLSNEEKNMIETQLHNVLIKTCPDHLTFNISELTQQQQIILSNNFCFPYKAIEKAHMCFATSDGSWILLPNYHNHLSLYSLSYGQQLKSIYKNLINCINLLDEDIHFAYTPDFGFSNSNINYIGNSLSFSLLLNLTGLELQGTVIDFINTCEETGYSLTPYVEYPNCGLFILSNQHSFGISELNHIDHMLEILNKLSTVELQAKKLILQDPENIELFIAQINNFFQQDSLNYEEITMIISLIDFLDKTLYNISNKILWIEQLFRLKELFDDIENPKIANQYRFKQLSHVFSQIVSLK